MFEFIENMRQKSETKRRLFALGVSTGVTAIILVVWFTTNFSGFSQSVVGTKSEVLGPFGSFKQNLAGAFSSFQESLGGVKETVEVLGGQVAEEYKAQLVTTYSTEE